MCSKMQIVPVYERVVVNEVISQLTGKIAEIYVVISSRLFQIRLQNSNSRCGSTVFLVCK